MSALRFILNNFWRFYYFVFDRLMLYPMVKFLAGKVDVKYLNLGYMPHDGDKEMLEILDSHLDPTDPMRAHSCLYEKTLSLCPSYKSMTGFKILEVGCGPGAGLQWIKRAHPEVESVVGIDRVVVDSMNGSIVQGNAENLPFNGNQFDMIVNIESSHLYANTGQFFKECARVLKNGGFLCWADIRYSKLMAEVNAETEAANLSRRAFGNITKGVLAGINSTSRRYDKLVEKSPWYVRMFARTMRTTYCAPGTESHRRLLDGVKIYAAACWQKG